LWSKSGEAPERFLGRDAPAGELDRHRGDRLLRHHAGSEAEAVSDAAVLAGDLAEVGDLSSPVQQQAPGRVA